VKKLLAVALFLTSSVFAADFSGRWSGTVEGTRSDGSTSTDSVQFNLKQDGAVVTGTGGGANDTFPIGNGRVDGNTATFEIQPEGRPVFKVKVTVDGDTMTGDASREREGRTMTAKLTLKREK
jgi:hypothetical protein